MSGAGIYERLMQVGAPVSARELNAFVRAIKQEVERLDFDYEQEPAAPMTFMSCDSCLGAETDAAAEWVRRGMRLGFWYAQYRRAVFANAVQRERQKRGERTKKAEIEERNAELAALYAVYVDAGLDDLQARQRLRDERGISLKVVNKAIPASSRRA